jgi:hypothetical protein
MMIKVTIEITKEAAITITTVETKEIKTKEAIGTMTLINAHKEEEEKVEETEMEIIVLAIFP